MAAVKYAEPVYLSAPTLLLGERVETVTEAVARGAIPAPVAEKYGYAELRVSDLAPVEMAERAALSALATAGVGALDLDEVLHAWTYFQGHDFWSPAHYVAARVGAARAVPLGVQQMCNGGMAAVEMAARHLLAEPEAQAILVTTADRFVPPGFDRWGGDLGVCYGDAATAVVVTRAPRAPAVRLLATRTAAAAELEAMHRGHAPFSPAPLGGTTTLLPRVTKRQFNERPDRADLAKMAYAALTDVLGRSLAAASVAPDDPRLRGVALPRLSLNGLEEVYRPAIGDVTGAEVFELGGRTGHLGAGDAVANLTSLLARDASPGAVFVLISAGAGFTWTSAVVEVA
ncbi:MAG: 3-oxoacyl-ACP synthase [Nonomuraea sp.]|nr:3-oxoacyl-ACP synthase [Nonomuraea sp.]